VAGAAGRDREERLDPGICARTRLSGNRRKIVRPAKAPRTAIWLADTERSFPLLARRSACPRGPAGGPAGPAVPRQCGWRQRPFGTLGQDSL